jgi:hypothetical protein
MWFVMEQNSFDRRVFIKRAGIYAFEVSMSGFLVWPTTTQAESPTLRRQLSWRIHFQNPSAQTLNQQRFWCYLPMNKGLNQRLVTLDVSMPHKVLADTFGHQILELVFDRVPALAQKTVSLRAEVELSNQRNSEDDSASQKSIWLSPEPFIESDHPKIQTLARELSRDTEIETTLSIYEWVKKNVNYLSYSPQDMGALSALMQGAGDCTESAYLVAALARANKIAARVVGGFVVNQNRTVNANDYHNWAEVYIDHVWHLIDAQQGYCSINNKLPHSEFIHEDKKHLLPVSDTTKLMPKNTHAFVREPYIAFHIHHHPETNPVGSMHRYRLGGTLEALL